MKKKIIIVITFIALIFSITTIPVHADSGWDSDYDYGSSSSSGGWSSSSGGGWSSSGRHSSSSGNSSVSYGGDSSGIILLVAIVIIIIILANNKNNKGGKNNSNNNDLTSSSNKNERTQINKIKEVIPTFDPEGFKQQAFNIYKDIQTAWMDFDTDTIRKLTTDEIYNMYKSQLETLKLKKQKNIMSDIKLQEIEITNATCENNIITIQVYLKVRCHDYVIKEKTKEVVRGTDKNLLLITYAITFVKSITNTNKIEKCPNCGAPVDINASATCEYCDSVLVKDSSEFVMSKKTCLNQQILRQ